MTIKGCRPNFWVPLLIVIFAAFGYWVTDASAAETRRELGSFGGASSSVVDPYPLSDPQGVAADDETEDVYVADAGNHRVEKFSATGQFLLAFGKEVNKTLGGMPSEKNVCQAGEECQAGVSGSTPGAFEHPQFVAVDNSTGASKGDAYVADTADNTVSKFSEKGKLEESWGVEGQLSGGCETPGESAPCSGSKVVPFGPIAGIAVGSTGTLYVMNTGGGVFEFEPSSKSLSAEFHLIFEYVGSYPVGLGVNSAGDLFREDEYGVEIEEYGPTGGFVSYLTNFEPVVTTALTVDSNGELFYVTANGALQHDAFNGAGEVLYPGGGTCSRECGASDSVGVGFAASGIAAIAGSGDTLLANAGDGTVYRYGPLVPAVPPETPETTAPKPQEIGTTTATLNGVLNPSSVGEPESGTYEFLYRQSASECEGAGGKATPAAFAAAKQGEAVSTVVGELLPGTVYTFCLRATNGVGETATGAPVKFTTLAAVPKIEEQSISDVAATSATLNAKVNPQGAETTYAFEYAPAGGTFVPVSEPGGSGTLPEGVTGVPVSVHMQKGLVAGTAYEFRVVVGNSVQKGVTGKPPVSFTTQPAAGAFVLPDARQWELVSPADKHGALLRPITQEGAVVQAAVGGDAMTFLASRPTEGEPLGYVEDEQVLSTRGPDGWSSRDISLAHEHEVSASVGQGHEYVAFSEDLSQALVQPQGAFEPSVSPEASEQTPYLRTLFVGGDLNDPCVEGCFRPVVTSKPGYANVESGAAFGGFGHEACLHQPLCGPIVTGATPDLSHIALYSESPLLPGGGGGEEYEWTNGQLSKGNHLPELPASTSEDGSWSYFVSREVLAPGAVPESCQITGSSVFSFSVNDGLCNLYVSHGGVTQLVAVLSEADYPDWRGSSSNDSPNDLSHRTSRVSPDGRWFAFMSQRELTGYNMHDAGSGKPDEEVYLYHAPESLASGAGTLVCASCNPTGARPVGREQKELADNEHRLVEPEDGPWSESLGQRIAASVPGWTPHALLAADYQSRYLSDSGRLFFNSNDALVPQDVNGNEDVYEYEPPSVGNCTTASVLFSPRSAGCVGLISSGQATGESAFLDASETGGDVFFLTTAKLAPQDVEGGLSLFDAHECTSSAPCFPMPAAVPPPCETGDACKPAPTPQPTNFGSTPSATFSGPGNITPEVAPPPKRVVKKTVKCKKRFVKDKQGKCVRAKSKKAKKKVKRAKHNGRGK